MNNALLLEYYKEFLERAKEANNSVAVVYAYRIIKDIEDRIKNDTL